MARVDYSAAIGLLEQVKTAVVCGHINPDGDSIGSTLALSAALNSLGIETTGLIPRNDPASPYAFLEGYEDLVAAKSYYKTPDLYVSVDVSSAERMGDGHDVFARARKTLILDHHIDGGEKADAVVRDANAAATGILVWDFIGALGVVRTAAMAQGCLAAVMTDTGRFQYQNADAQAFMAASQMVAAGADASALALQIYQRKSMAAIQLESLAAQRLELHFGNRAALSWATAADFERLGAVKADAEGMINVIRSLNGVEIAVMLREQDGVIRGSIRSKNERDVAAIARRFDGGGHKAAAGFTIKDDLETARELVLKALQEEFNYETSDN